MTSDDSLTPGRNAMKQLTDRAQAMTTESLCMRCHETGTTTMLLTSIPFFRDVLLTSFECPHCDYKDTATHNAASLAPTGQIISLRVEGPEDVSRQVVKSDYASIRVPALKFEVPADTQKGVCSTVEGILLRSVEGLEEGQTIRRALQPEVAEQIDGVIAKLRQFAKAEEVPFDFILEDPSGHSYIQKWNLEDANPSMTHFERMPAHLEMMGYLAPKTTEEEDAASSDSRGVSNPSLKPGGDLPEHLRVKNWDLNKSLEENVITMSEESTGGSEEGWVFECPCAHCGQSGKNNMCQIDIPGFRKCILMAFVCDHCGFKSSEIRPGGAYGAKGRRWQLRVSDVKDLSRDILKSDAASVEIPELDFTMKSGSLGSFYSTVEGLLIKIADSMAQAHPFVGDSASDEMKNPFLSAIQRIRQLAADPSTLPFTLIVEDPADHSFLGHREFETKSGTLETLRHQLDDETLERLEVDENLTWETFTRTEEHDDDLGITGMVVDGYESQQEGGGCDDGGCDD